MPTGEVERNRAQCRAHKAMRCGMCCGPGRHQAVGLAAGQAVGPAVGSTAGSVGS